MTVAEFVAALGGNPETAKLFGVTRPAVCNWKAVNRLPERLHFKAFMVATERNLRFDPQRPSKPRKSVAA